MTNILANAYMADVLKKARIYASSNGSPKKFNGQSVACADYSNDQVTFRFEKLWLPILESIDDDLLRSIIETLAESDQRHTCLLIRAMAEENTMVAKVMMLCFAAHFCHGRSGKNIANIIGSGEVRFPMMKAIKLLLGVLSDHLPVSADTSTSPARNHNPDFLMREASTGANTTIAGSDLLCTLASVPGISVLFWAAADITCSESSAFGIAVKAKLFTGAYVGRALLIDYRVYDKLFPGSKVDLTLAWIHTYLLLMRGGRNDLKVNLRLNRAKGRQLENLMRESSEAHAAIHKRSGIALDKAMGFSGYSYVHTDANPYDSIENSPDAVPTETRIPDGAEKTRGAYEPNNASLPEAKSGEKKASPGLKKISLSGGSGLSVAAAGMVETIRMKKALVAGGILTEAEAETFSDSDLQKLTDQNLV